MTSLPSAYNALQMSRSSGGYLGVMYSIAIGNSTKHSFFVLMKCNYLKSWTKLIHGQNLHQFTDKTHKVLVRSIPHWTMGLQVKGIIVRYFYLGKSCGHDMFAS